MFISFEGIDGSGKTTQAALLAETLRTAGHEVVLTREPGGSAGAEQIRRLLVEGSAERWSPETELLLFAAARRDHLERTIRPALERGAWVITDRFVDSSRVYQGAARADLRHAVDSIHALMIEIEPDLTFVIDMDPAEALARTRRRAAAGSAPGGAATATPGHAGPSGTAAGSAVPDGTAAGEAAAGGLAAGNAAAGERELRGAAPDGAAAPTLSDPAAFAATGAAGPAASSLTARSPAACPPAAVAPARFPPAAAAVPPVEERFESMGLAFQTRLRDGFRALAADHPHRVHLIDGTGNPADIAACIRALL